MEQQSVADGASNAPGRGGGEGGRYSAAVELTLVDTATATIGGAGPAAGSARASAGAARPPRRRRGRLRAAATALLAFWTLDALMLLVLLLPSNLDSLLRGRRHNSDGAGQRPWRLWWNSPPEQALLFATMQMSAAALASLLTSPGRTLGRRSAAALATFFLATVAVFLAAPEFAYLDRSTTVQPVPYDTGNCSALSSLRPVRLQDAAARACPRWVGLASSSSSGGDADADDADADADDAAGRGPGIARADFVKVVLSTDTTGAAAAARDLGFAVDTLEKVKDGLPTMASLIGKGENKGLWSLLYCHDVMARAMCSYVWRPCRYSDCAESVDGMMCDMAMIVDDWSACIEANADACEPHNTNPLSCNDSPSTVILQTLESVASLLTEFGPVLLDAEMAKFAEDILDRLIPDVERMIHAASSANSSSNGSSVRGTHAPRQCSSMWRSDTADAVAPDRAGDPRVGCDPYSREYTPTGGSSGPSSFEGGSVFVLVFLLLCAFVTLTAATRDENMDTLPAADFFVNARDRNARIFSVVLGLFAAVFIFIGGQNFENEVWRRIDGQHADDAVYDDGVAAAEIFNLRLWAIVYYCVSLTSLHHAFYLLVSGPDAENVSGTCFRRLF